MCILIVDSMPVIAKNSAKVRKLTYICMYILVYINTNLTLICLNNVVCSKVIFRKLCTFERTVRAVTKFPKVIIGRLLSTYTNNFSI